ncbi:MAG: thermonuclease family protein [Planctomycetaceae bacterium]|nr:thermonuclease family protein [Planctomycetaceae bacterium]
MSRFRSRKYSNGVIVNSIGRLLKLNRSQKALLSVVVLAVAVVGYLFFDGYDANSYTFQNGLQRAGELREGIFRVANIVDGDTIDVIDGKGQKHRIRFIGANTPETAKKNKPAEPFADKAMNFTKRIIEANGNQVRIKFDGDQVDKYGRNLAMIYVKTQRGEIWLNEVLILEGLARARLQYNFSNFAKERFKNAEQNAKNSQKNIWSM